MKKPVRILQVVYSMGLGGIETWLMNVLRNIDRRQFIFEFLVYTTQPHHYDEEVISLGSRIIQCIHPSKGIKHILDLSKILKVEAPFDVIHVHGSQNIGNTLRMAAGVHIPIRIAHSHNATNRSEKRIRSRLFQPIANYWLKKYMTVGLGASGKACAHLFGNKWRSDPRCNVFFSGIDWRKYRQQVDKNRIKTALGLPSDSTVIGHVGRFVTEKNHTFFVEIAHQITRMSDNVYFLLVGDGQLRCFVEKKVEDLELRNNFFFTGVQVDTWVLLQCMDVFFFPSLFEGLGIALIEAQAVGLPCVVSNTVPGEAAVVKELVTRLSLSDSKKTWANAVLDAALQKRKLTHQESWSIVSASRFSISSNIETLSKIYLNQTI